ncbi:MAG: arginine--tRNA ligase [Patescibacteria group bacterium]|nr:arginine--tRNA ligase [Patescibacteria group bacterium]
MINETIKKAITKALKEAGFSLDEKEIELEHPKDLSFGDYATNAAMKIAKKAGQNPLEVAKKIAEKIKLAEVEKIEPVAPGFINFYLSKDFLFNSLKEIQKEGKDFGHSDLGKNKTIVIDYSHPNIAKPIGVHHLLTTLIGESIKRTYQFLGYKTIADNFLGDWGTQFGKTIYAFKTWGDKKIVEKDPVNELLKLYVKFHEEAEKHPELDDKAREEFKKLEEGDKENTNLWKWMREESLRELKEVYKTLDVSFDYYNGEAFYNDKTPEVFDILNKKGLLKAGEEGAKIVDLEKDKLGVALIQKKDEATLYLTRDLAALKYRTQNFKPEKILYVVENRQTFHLAQLFKISELAGILNGIKPVHVKFGTMRFPDETMSTRKGKVVFLWSVLEEATKKALTIIQEKNPDLKDKEKVAEMVGIGAVKYAILSQNRLTQVKFTWDKMLNLEGNSGPYVMYSYARAKSILRKADAKEFRIQNLEFSLEKEEEALLKKLYTFPEVIERAAEEYDPNIIANFVYNLSQDFNAFYNKLPVLKADESIKGLRLKLVEATAQVVKNSMKLLSIDLPEEM